VKISHVLLVLGAVGLLADRAQADPPSAQPEPTEQVIPTLSLSAASSGKGKISAGLDIRTSTKDGGWEPHISPSFTVASSSDGVANLLAISGDTKVSGPSDWALGLTLSMIDVHPEDWLPAQADYLLALARCRTLAQSSTASASDKAFFLVHAKAAVDQLPFADPLVKAAVDAAAHASCSTGTAGMVDCGKTLADLAAKCASPFDPVCTWLGTVDTSLTEKQLCLAGQEMLKPGDEVHVERGRYPRKIFAVGATYGATQFKSLTGPTTALALNTETHSNFTLGALFTYVRPDDTTHFTLEVPVLFKSSYKAQSATAKWCVPAGTVATKSGDSAAQTCDEQPIGSPQHQSQIWAAVLLGAATEKGAVRFAAGPTFSYDAASTSAAPYQIGLQTPLYIRMAKNVGNYSGDFEGIVRLVPSFAMNHTDKGFTPVGTVTVELLAKRGMFGSSLYWP
jgi:hypothetical protein